MMGLKGLFIQLALVAQLYTASAGTLGQDRLLITQETDYKLGLRTLALSGSDGYASFLQTIFGGYGHPVDVIKVQPDQSTILSLYADNGDPRYGSIVLSDTNLYAVNGSALAKSEWLKLTEYRQRYNIRTVSLDGSYFDINPGLVKDDRFAGGTDADAELFFEENEFTDQYLGFVKKGAVIKTGSVTPFLRNPYYWYPSQVDPQYDADGQIITFAKVRSAMLDGEGTDKSYPIGIVHNSRDGLETMYFMMNTNQYSHHGPLFAAVWLPWVTKGFFIGERRYLLSAQIDDVLLSTNTYVNATYIDPKAFRISGQDLAELEAFQARLNGQLPQESRIVIEHAFNGLGYDTRNDYGTGAMQNGLAQAAIAVCYSKYGAHLAILPNPQFNESLFWSDQFNAQLRDHFFWVSHTWSHIDMYCPDSDCEKNGLSTYEYVYPDLTKNRDFADNVLFADKLENGVPVGPMTSEERDSWPTYSPYSMVTPRISGLNNTNSIQALLDTNYEYVVGDNSRADLKPNNPFWMFPTNTTYNGQSVDVIPRYPTRIFFDVSLPSELEREFNDIYGPNCYGHELPTSSYPYKCSQATFRYPSELTTDDIMALETFDTVRNLLLGISDPYMFHQANLRYFDTEDGNRHSLLSLWLEDVLRQLTKYISAPVYTLKMEDLARFFAARKARDTCGTDGYTEYVGGAPARIVLTSDNKCTASLTRAAGVGYTYADGRTELQYGTDRTLSLDMPGSKGQVILPLAAIGDSNAAAGQTTRLGLKYPPMSNAEELGATTSTPSPASTSAAGESASSVPQPTSQESASSPVAEITSSPAARAAAAYALAIGCAAVAMAILLM